MVEGDARRPHRTRLSTSSEAAPSWRASNKPALHCRATRKPLGRASASRRETKPPSSPLPDQSTDRAPARLRWDLNDAHHGDAGGAKWRERGLCVEVEKQLSAQVRVLRSLEDPSRTKSDDGTLRSPTDAQRLCLPFHGCSMPIARTAVRREPTLRGFFIFEERFGSCSFQAGTVRGRKNNCAIKWNRRALYVDSRQPKGKKGMGGEPPKREPLTGGSGHNRAHPNLSRPRTSPIARSRKMAAERLPPPASLDTTSPAIYFYYDIASPFSYLALELLNRYIPKEWPEVKLELRPCSLYHIRLWAGNWPGPPGNDFRMRTLMRDTARMRKLYGIPIAPINKVFPANAGGANKLLAWFHINRPELVAPATLALFEAYWRDELVPSEPDVVAKYVGPVYPEGVEALRALYADASKMDSKEVTDLLEAHAKEASESYAIGTPFFNVVKPVPGGKPKVEGFFGTDRMEHVADFLDLPWKGWIPPSATRTPGTEELIDVGDASIMFKQVTPLIEALTKAEAEAKAAAEVKSKV